MDCSDSTGVNLENLSSEPELPAYEDMQMTMFSEDRKKCSKCDTAIPDGSHYVECSHHDHENLNDKLNNLTFKQSPEDRHYLCGNCVRAAVNYVIKNRDTECVTPNGIGLFCVGRLLGCHGIFKFCHMSPFLIPEARDEIQNISAEHCLKAFIEDNPLHEKQVKCSKCGHPAFVSDSLRWYQCPNLACHFYQCTHCGRAATKAHEIRSCEEMGIAESFPTRGFLHYADRYLYPQ